MSVILTALKNGVKNIQAASYNGTTCTVVYSEKVSFSWHYLPKKEEDSFQIVWPSPNIWTLQ